MQAATYAGRAVAQAAQSCLLQRSRGSVWLFIVQWSSTDEDCHVSLHGVGAVGWAFCMVEGNGWWLVRPLDATSSISAHPIRGENPRRRLLFPKTRSHRRLGTSSRIKSIRQLGLLRDGRAAADGGTERSSEP